MTTPPLHGCRVLDLGIITAGAATSALLADMGADVIKVESPTYRDPFRLWTGDAGINKGMPPFFRSTNRNKTSISIDLKHSDGRAAFLRLVAKSDVVVENFRRGVLKRLALDYPDLRAVNPNIILASISSQGETGPDAGHVSYGTTLEAVGGLAWNTGYANGKPVVSGRDLNYPDQIAAIFSAGMIATALRACRAGDGGAHLDISQRELTSFLCSETFFAEAADQPARSGNAQAPHRLQDCFRAADTQWIAVTLDDGDVARLKTIVGLTGGHGSDAELREGLARWIGAHEGEACVEALTAAGIAAAPAHDGRSLLRDRGRLWGMAVENADDGELLKGFPFQWRESPLSIRRDAPEIGADTIDVLERVGGYSRAEIDAMAKAGIIETES